jgi:predicted peroxiredoxin
MPVRKTILAFFTATALLLTSTTQLLASDSDSSLFVNLTSDNLDRAAMAINFSTRVRQQKNIPVTLFLNVEGVRIADKRIPEKKHANGKSLKQMLDAFMQAGGKVIVCPMCMKNVGGMTKADLVSGAVVGASDVTWPALFADDTTVLSY